MGFLKLIISDTVIKLLIFPAHEIFIYETSSSQDMEGILEVQFKPLSKRNPF